MTHFTVDVLHASVVRILSSYGRSHTQIMPTCYNLEQSKWETTTPPIIATANHEWKMTRFEFWTWNDFVILDFEVKEGVFSFTYYSVKFR